MDLEKIKRRQSIKLIVSESIMVIAVVVTVAILTLIVSGYWLNSDFTVARQGMLQISSTPAGADLYVDGETSWFQRTNTSKILTSGEHVITLSKDGYDSWSRTINISDGLLYRIHYPRLFLEKRESEKVFDASKYTFATVSPNRKLALLLNDTTEWALLNLDSEIIKTSKIDIAPFFSGVSLASGASVGLFSGTILSSEWDQNNEHILFKVATAGQVEWVLLDVVNPTNTVNLTKEFGVNFDIVKIFDNSSSSLLTVQNGNLRRIDARNKTISASFVKNVVDFDYYDNEIIFSALVAGEGYRLGVYKLDNPEIEELETTIRPTRVSLFQFYTDKYIASLSENELTLHDREDYSKITTFNLSFAPETFKVGHHGEFITMTTDNMVATLDMEDRNLREWTTSGKNFGWLDNDMIYSVKDGELTVYDFDGLNARTLAKNASEHFPVAITLNKWLYYFSDGNLIREIIAK